MNAIKSGFFDILRMALWLFTSVCLRVCDYVYGILASFFRLNLGDFSWVWKIYWVLAGAIGVFVLIRLAIVLFRSYYSDDSVQKLGGSGLLNRMIMIGLITTLMPVVLPMFSTITSSVTDYMNMGDVQPSDILIESGNVTFSDGNLGTSESLNLDDGQHALDVITSETITDKEADKKTYKYIPHTEDIVLIIVLGGMCCYVFVAVAVQVISRLIGLLMKVLIAPYSLSGLVDPNDNSTSVWFRSCMADFLTAFFQLMLIWVVMYLVSHLPDSITGLSKGLVFIAAVMSILVAPSGIGQLLGGDIGGQSGMQMLGQMHALRDTARAGIRLGSAAAKTAGAAAVVGATFGLKGASGAIYGIGQKFGARTLNPAKMLSSSSGNGPRGGSSGGGFSGGGFSGGGSAGGGFSGGETPPERQIQGGGAGSFGSVGEQSMTYGEHSQGLEQGSMNNAFYAGQGMPGGTIGASGEAGSASDNSAGTSLGYTVGKDGILHYSDGQVTNLSSSSMARKLPLATVMGNRIYQAAGAYWLTSKNQRKQLRRENSEVGWMKTAQAVSNFKNDYVNAVKNAINPMKQEDAQSTQDGKGLL